MVAQTLDHHDVFGICGIRKDSGYNPQSAAEKVSFGAFGTLGK